MTDERKRSSQLVASWVQVGMLACTIIAAVLHIGKKDQQLETTTLQVKELSSIVSELTKTQVGLTLKTEQTEARLLDIISRLNKLEDHR